MTDDAWHPRHSPWLIALTVMLSTFMEVLDTSVANVALPNIAGNLSVSSHEATWVLTSYLVSNAIILPATAWFAGFFGRKRFLMGCVVLFTVASAFCGLATSLGFLITARVIQGIGGGALQPISQAILLESFPKERRGVAMAVFALGVIVAPIIGPTVGGWITDNYSWRWIFLINLPVGVLAIVMTRAFVEDPPYLRKVSAHDIDVTGFSLMAIGLGTLQIVLDKGQEADWFAAPWLRGCAFLIVFSLAAFVWWELTVSKNPVVHLRILKNVNFATGTVLITVVGAVLYGTTALLPLFLQGLMGYTAYLSGLAVSPRGVAAFVVAIIVGRLITKADARLFVAAGLAVLGLSCYRLGNVNFDVGLGTIIWSIVGTGIGMSAIFVPLSTLSVGTLEREEIGNATGLFNLMRNIGGSIGIAAMTTALARMSQVHQATLVGHLTPYDPAYQQSFQKISQLLAPFGPGGGVSNPLPYAVIYRELLRQASLLSFVDCFRGFGILCLVCVPAVFLFKRTQTGTGAPAAPAS